MHNFTTNKEAPSRKGALSDRHPEGFIASPRAGEAELLAKEDPSMFAFLAQIAFRVYRTHPPRNKRNLRIKQCFISGAADLALTDRAYRTLTQRAVKLGAITAKPTNKGTVFELISTAIFDINEVVCDEQSTSTRRAPDELATSGEIEEPSPNPHEQRAEAVFAVSRQERKNAGMEDLEKKESPRLQVLKRKGAVFGGGGFPPLTEEDLRQVPSFTGRGNGNHHFQAWCQALEAKHGGWLGSGDDETWAESYGAQWWVRWMESPARFKKAWNEALSMAREKRITASIGGAADDLWRNGRLG